MSSVSNKVLNVDLSGLVLGRAASIIAQKLLEGYHINAYNAEKIVITGDIKDIYEKYHEKQTYQAKGNPNLGPKYPKYPDAIFRRTVRNMLPHQKPRGKEALSRLIAHNGAVPQGIETYKLEAAEVKRGYRVVELSVISHKLGVNW